jgi:hypothetical protein
MEGINAITRYNEIQNFCERASDEDNYKKPCDVNIILYLPQMYLVFSVRLR